MPARLTIRTYPIPFNEEARLRSLLGIPGLTAQNEALFDSICRATRELLGCQLAHISIVEDEGQWYKSVVGYDLGPMPRDTGFCAHTIMSDQPMVVPDLSKDPRFASHPMVAEGGPQARYYAGVPLILSSGHRFGSLCGIDLVPHDPPSERELSILTELGRAVVAALEARPPETTAHRSDEVAKSTFIALIGHELRTPLTILFGSLQLLELTLGKGANPKLLTGARKSVDHIIKLVETIIAFSDASTGELRLNERHCDLSDILDEVAAMQLPGKDGAIKTVALADDSIDARIYLDPDQIWLALDALILNAINHGGADVTVGARQVDGGHIEIDVCDSGSIGDHVDLARLYAPFVVGGNIDNRDTRGGLGLGLPLTRKLVELHGGEFEVRAEPDRTRAIIRLPVWRTQMPETKIGD
ncbi:GAF domain-containing sensor histidine kinase [Tropicimonas sp. IMCC34011]|uniref:GAF domain-containing sensor histidine kinase n=1 Tax=Tropicimonas sp. IMCC34011 TaxID=2248759 RepID=UPI001E63B14C|nr:GAF domain-containing sensor histidine kinase [Tropicimonas sp. IMCC34011]